MPTPVYSVRFLLATGNGIVVTYTVPAGHRAVVRSVLATNEQATASYFYVQLNGFSIWAADLPAARRSVDLECRLVAAAGERIGVYTVGPEIRVAVSGYLFVDTGAGSEVQGEVTRERVEEVQPLPVRAVE